MKAQIGSSPFAAASSLAYSSTLHAPRYEQLPGEALEAFEAAFSDAWSLQLSG
jgi:hypothetical protein